MNPDAAPEPKSDPGVPVVKGDLRATQNHVEAAMRRGLFMSDLKAGAMTVIGIDQQFDRVVLHLGITPLHLDQPGLFLIFQVDDVLAVGTVDTDATVLGDVADDVIMRNRHTTVRYRRQQVTDAQHVDTTAGFFVFFLTGNGLKRNRFIFLLLIELMQSRRHLRQTDITAAQVDIQVVDRVEFEITKGPKGEQASRVVKK